jgi:hypothetical protein
MKKLLFLLFLIFFFQNTYGTEVNLNGLKIKLKDDQSYLTKYTKKKVLKSTLTSLNVNKENFDSLWQTFTNGGYSDDDKNLLVAPTGNFLSLMDEKLIHGTDYSSMPLTMNLVNNCNAKSRTKKQSIKCFVKKSSTNYFMEFSYASNPIPIDKSLLKEIESKDLVRFTKENFNKFINKKNMTLISNKVLINFNTKGDYYIEYRNKSKMNNGLKKIKVESWLFEALVDNKLFNANLYCYEKKFCDQAEKEFMDIFKQVFKLEGNLLKTDLSNIEELITFINTHKKAYRAFQFARFVMMMN